MYIREHEFDDFSVRNRLEKYTSFANGLKNTSVCDANRNKLGDGLRMVAALRVK